MQNLINTIDNWTLIKVLGGLSVVVSALFGFLAGAFKDYLGHRWRANQETQLETLKHQFSKAEVLLQTLTSSGSSAYLATNVRRIDHLEKLWKGMISIKNRFPTLANTAYSILTRIEIETLPKTSNPHEVSEIQSFRPNEYFDFHFSVLNELEPSRPFVGQHAWNAFYSYQALHGRLVHLLRDGLSKGKVTYWIDDRQFLNQVIGLSIPIDTLSALLRNEAIAFDNLRNFLELAIISDVEAQMSGSAAMQETAKQAQQLSEASSTAFFTRS